MQCCKRTRDQERCGALMYGSLIKTLETAGIWPDHIAASAITMSGGDLFTHLISARFFVLPAGRSKHNEHVHCNLQDEWEQKLNNIYESMLGEIIALLPTTLGESSGTQSFSVLPFQTYLYGVNTPSQVHPGLLSIKSSKEYRPQGHPTLLSTFSKDDKVDVHIRYIDVLSY